LTGLDGGTLRGRTHGEIARERSPDVFNKNRRCGLGKGGIAPVGGLKVVQSNGWKNDGRAPTYRKRSHDIPIGPHDNTTGWAS
jgi:hypothetical protein